MKKLLIIGTTLLSLNSCSNDSKLYINNPNVDCKSLESYYSEDNQQYLSFCFESNVYNYNNVEGEFTDITDSTNWKWNKIYLLDKKDSLITSKPCDTCNYMFVYSKIEKTWTKFIKNY